LGKWFYVCCHGFHTCYLTCTTCSSPSYDCFLNSMKKNLGWWLFVTFHLYTVCMHADVINSINLCEGRLNERWGCCGLLLFHGGQTGGWYGWLLVITLPNMPGLSIIFNSKMIN
jgi:hypothetical protein